MDNELQFDKKFKLAIITSIPHNTKSSKLEEFKKYISKLIHKIETYNNNISCKLIIINQLKQTKNSDYISLLPDNLFKENSLEFNNRSSCYFTTF